MYYIKDAALYQHFLHISILKSGKKKNELMWVMLTLKSLWRKIDIIGVYHTSQKCLSLYIRSHNTPMSVGHRGRFLCLSKQGRNLCNVVEILRKFNKTPDLFSVWLLFVWIFCLFCVRKWRLHFLVNGCSFMF